MRLDTISKCSCVLAAAAATTTGPRRPWLHASALAGLCLLAAGAHADITPRSSSLLVNSIADVDPDDVNVPDTDSDSTGPVLRNFALTSAASEGGLDLFESVVANASVGYSGVSSITVQFFGARSGRDDTFGPPGGEYESRAAYRMEFENLAPGELTVAWTLNFERPSTGVTAPLGIGLRRAGIFDSRGLDVPFAARSGTAAGTETFELDRTGPTGVYTLELDLFMAGRTTDVSQAEMWDATFLVSTPAMTITPVPEPSLPGLFLAGLGLLALRHGLIKHRRPRTRP